MNLRNSNRRGGAHSAFEGDQASGFRTDRFFVAAGALSTGAKDLATGTNSQNACAGLGRLGLRAEFREHGFEHCSGDFIAAIRIVQRECQNLAGLLNFN